MERPPLLRHATAAVGVLMALLVVARGPVEAETPATPVLGVGVRVRTGERLTVVRRLADLPDRKPYAVLRPTGEVAYFDIGYRWDETRILACPTSVSNDAWCGFVGPSEYVDLSYAVLADMARKEGIPMPAGGVPGFSRWGGRVLLGFLVTLLLTGLLLLRVPEARPIVGAAVEAVYGAITAPFRGRWGGTPTVRQRAPSRRRRRPRRRG